MLQPIGAARCLSDAIRTFTDETDNTFCLPVQVGGVVVQSRISVAHFGATIPLFSYIWPTITVAAFGNSNAAYDAASALKKLRDETAIDFKPKAGVMVKNQE